ncbi:uncharacterized protein LOC120640858 [Panicum virgatum]|uniref:Uncharacterized protein n=1 Tax=Panicum virgatum TaxID=38727 RepID=A0A8T0XEK2_PANVG|nr:uncharacterized protein LOC120640858 [Panicum virgatum]KAG2655814.1 hypothetical protein PVAP13_1KG039200 [Panicum virgatum]
MATRPRLDSVLSFGDAAPPPAGDELAASDAGSDCDEGEFEFAFAAPLAAAPGSGGAGDVLVDLAPADDLFAHGRILPAYPVFDRHLLLDRDGDGEAAPAAPRASSSSTAPPSPDTFCAWAPRSAPGSPTRDPGPPFPKSASTGDARRFWRLRGLVSGAGGRSHSDGKEKFVFLQQPAAKASAPAQKQSKKKSAKAAAGAAGTEMDMATAHKLFYGKPAGGALAGDRRHQQQQQSYLPYRPGIVGFFTPAHALGRSHHPY